MQAKAKVVVYLSAEYLLDRLAACFVDSLANHVYPRRRLRDPL